MISTILLSVLAQSSVLADRVFVFTADRDLKSVSVAGTFNGWNRDVDQLTRQADGKTWKRTIKLPVGRHQYKFVLNGETWITDPLAAKNEDDGNGNINSILTIYPADYSQPGRLGDGMITQSPLAHRQVIPDLNFDRNRLSFRFTARPDDISRITLVSGSRRVPMAKFGGNEFTATYRAELAWNGRDRLTYFFELEDGPAKTRFGSDGLRKDAQPFSLSPSNFKPFQVPNWVEGSIFYQIFPERFENGNPGNDPAGVIPWGGEPKYFNFMGGDLAGVSKRLDHLKSLGINAIYLNPIFVSPSNHGYETTDYKRVEPRFGSNEEFVSLVKQLRSAGIRTVLDGVFNHTSVDFPAFQDLKVNGEKSKYKSWFFVRSFPIKVQENPTYEAWFNFPSMPKLNVLNPEVTAYLMDVIRFWEKEAGIDGWRLDVANEVPDEFWRTFRKEVKKIDGGQRWIVGEVWGDGGRWLQGDQWDSVMNYQFRDAAIRFIAKDQMTATQFMDRLMATYASYAPQVSRNLLNLLGSHDTPRFRTECGGDADLAKLGASMLLTWVGSPSIYYGDELGMEGKQDPDNRRGMQWNLASDRNEILTHYRRLIALRRKSKALQSGDPIPLATSDTQKTVAFAREVDGDVAIVVINRSTEAQPINVKIPASLTKSMGQTLADQLGQARVVQRADSVSVTVPRLSTAVLLPIRQSDSQRSNP